MNIRSPKSLLLFLPLFREFPQRIKPAILTCTLRLAVVISYRFLHHILKMTPKISQHQTENNKDFIKTVLANKLTEVVKSYAPCVDIFLQNLQNINIHGKLFRITHTRFSHWRGLLWTARSLII